MFSSSFAFCQSSDTISKNKQIRKSYSWTVIQNLAFHESKNKQYKTNKDNESNTNAIHAQNLEKHLVNSKKHLLNVVMFHVDNGIQLCVFTYHK